MSDDKPEIVDPQGNVIGHVDPEEWDDLIEWLNEDDDTPPERFIS